jgi:hypothetical protein
VVASFTMMRSSASYAIVDATGVNTICFEVADRCAIFCATPVTTNVLGGSGTDYALDSRTRNQWRQPAIQASDLIAE